MGCQKLLLCSFGSAITTYQQDLKPLTHPYTIGMNSQLIQSQLKDIAIEKSKFDSSNLENLQHKSKNVLVVLSEGIRNEEGNYLKSDNNIVDNYGHSTLGGVGAYVKNFIYNNVDKRVKLVDLGIGQRCAIHCVSKSDIDDAILVGKDAVNYAIQGGFMVTLNRLYDNPYQCITGLAKLKDVCNKIKYIPREWLNEDNNSSFTRYISPLIVGEYNCWNSNGLIKYADIEKVNL